MLTSDVARLLALGTASAVGFALGLYSLQAPVTLGGDSQMAGSAPEAAAIGNRPKADFETAAPSPEPEGEKPTEDTGLGMLAALTKELSGIATAMAIEGPTIELLRVDEDGAGLIGGRAEPDATIVVTDGEEVLGKTDADPSGDYVVILDKPLPNGSYTLQLEEHADGNVRTSKQSIIVSRSDDSAPDARVARGRDVSDANGGVAQTYETDALAFAAPMPAKRPVEGLAGGEVASLPLFIEAIEVEKAQLFVAGAAEAGRRIRLYIDDIFAGEVEASEANRFLFELDRPIQVGSHKFRVDGIDEDEVTQRAAVDFERLPGESVAAVDPSSSILGVAKKAMGGPLESAGGDSQGIDVGPIARHARSGVRTVKQDAMVPVGRSVIIRRSDTLWQIAQRVYGAGFRYTTIYRANSEQIQDPDLIFPGQVFDVPKSVGTD